MNVEPIFRHDEIIKLCKGKSVFHLGFIQHAHLYEEKIAASDWLHEKISNVAKELVGLDYLEEDVSKIKAKYDYDCVFGDVTKLDQLNLERQFDVIVCGELIEHIENAGLMLEGLKRFMHDESELIITTPNPWSTARIGLIENGVLEDTWLNKEHTCWYSFGTLRQILERKGYKEVDYGYYFGHNKTEIAPSLAGSLKSKLKTLLRKRRAYNSPKYKHDGLFFRTKK